MIALDEVGAHPVVAPDGSLSVKIGTYLPGIAPDEGYQVVARIIHRNDRFDPNVPPQDVDLIHQAGHALDLWTATIPLTPVGNTSFGMPGTYLYRFALWQRRGLVTLWFSDPFARATDIGELAAFTTPGVERAMAWTDDGWKTPEIDDLVVYELHVEEFNDTFAGIVDRLPYLKSLGVNVLELMPVTSLKLDFDWGYGPLHYFAPNARWGGGAGLKNLVNAAHANEVAVIVDVVYQHVDPAFPYALVYRDANKQSPMIGPSGPFGPTIDYSGRSPRTTSRSRIDTGSMSITSTASATTRSRICTPVPPIRRMRSSPTIRIRTRSGSRAFSAREAVTAGSFRWRKR